MATRPFLLYAKALAAKTKYDSAVGALEKSISDKVKFEFGVEYQPSDGFTLLNIESHQVAPLSFCLNRIAAHGELTEEYHKSISI